MIVRSLVQKSFQNVWQRNTLTYALKQHWKYWRLTESQLGERVLIFVGTKYEFGKDGRGNILLIDKVHSLDSSRYWLASSYNKRIATGLEPDKKDKEFLRLLFAKNCNPYEDKAIPAAPKYFVVEL